MNDKKKILLIVNPCAGPDRKRTDVKDIIALFDKDRFELEVHETKGRGDATEIALEHIEGKDIVVCNGGDGTLNETINGVVRSAISRPGARTTLQRRSASRPTSRRPLS